LGSKELNALPSLEMNWLYAFFELLIKEDFRYILLYQYEQGEEALG
jgi:hypothetical protein